MKALFLAGGKGTRLRPLTDHLPKPMVPMMGKPLLQRNIDSLKQCGTDEIVISTCYRSECIEAKIEMERIGVKVNCACEDIPLGTGGAIKNCERYFDDSFLVFNSDILCNINLERLFRFHKEKHADVTIAAIRVENPSSYGVIEYNSEDFATSFTEKPKPGEEKSNYINAGIYVFEPEVLKMIPANRVVSIEKDTYPLLLEKGCKIAVYRENAYWIDIGTPEKYLKAHWDIFSGACRIPENDFTKNEIYRLSGVSIHGSAKITGPVWLGKNVRIGANVSLGPNVAVSDGFQTGRGCVIRNSVIWDGVTVGSGVTISNSIITSGCRVGSGIQCLNTIYSQESKRPFVI